MKIVGLVVLLIVLSLNAFADSDEEKGLAIAIKMEDYDSGWADQQAVLKMILRDAYGGESVRESRIKSLEVTDDGDKSLIVFDSPRTVKGTTFLSYSHILKPDDQWMFLPALKRVKRISSFNKSGPFLGSEFAYEDISSQEVGKYSYKFLYDDVIDGRDVYVKERYPEYKNSGYSRQIVWVDKVHYRPAKIEFYDRNNTLLKTLMYKKYRQYLDKHWRPDEMEMVNHQTGKSTLLVWENYVFQSGLSFRDFDKNSLKRTR